MLSDEEEIYSSFSLVSLSLSESWIDEERKSFVNDLSNNLTIPILPQNNKRQNSPIYNKKISKKNCVWDKNWLLWKRVLEKLIQSFFHLILSIHSINLTNQWELALEKQSW